MVLQVALQRAVRLAVPLHCRHDFAAMSVVSGGVTVPVSAASGANSTAMSVAASGVVSGK